MKVSIITPCFNSSATLRDTIESVARQDYPEIEYIIIDGGSTDQTLDIIKAYPKVVDLWISETDDSLYEAMNKGIHLASGDIIAIINSDDFYVHSAVISLVVQQFKRNRVDSIYGDIQYVAPQNTQRVIRNWVSGKYQRHNFLYGWMPPHPAFFVKKTVYDALGFFDTRLQTSADYELMLRFLYKHRVSSHYLPELLVRMRAGGVSNRSWLKRFEANLEDRKAWKMNGLRPYFFTAVLKPIRKIKQFFTPYHIPQEPQASKPRQKLKNTKL